MVNCSRVNTGAENYLDTDVRYPDAFKLASCGDTVYSCLDGGSY